MSIAGSCSMGEQVVVRVDASIVECHSRKQGAAGTYKGGFGHQPVGAWIDNTGELGSLLLRPGNAAPNNPADLILAVDEATGQIPAAWRHRLLATSDTAGASHEFIGWLDQLNTADNGMAVEYFDRLGHHHRGPGRGRGAAPRVLDTGAGCGHRRGT